jgi:hypothetical protein
MSYDLYLFSHSGTLNKSAFEAYFGARPKYKLQNSQASYENEDTGVYFSFDLPSTNDEVDLDDTIVGYALAFNLNLCRPSFFATEAAKELAAATREYGLAVFDPQGIPERREFKEDEFIANWRQANQKATAVLRQGQPDLEIVELPNSVLNVAWNWNYSRSGAQAELGEDVFVPKILFVRWRGYPATATVWTDAISVLLPKTDTVLIYRDTLAHRRWLRRQPDVVPIPWSEVERELLPFSRVVREHGNNALLYKSKSQSVKSFVRGLAESIEKIEGISMDHHCDTMEAG